MFPNESYHVNFRKDYEQNFRTKPEFYSNKNPIFGLIEAFLNREHFYFYNNQAFYIRRYYSIKNFSPYLN